MAKRKFVVEVTSTVDIEIDDDLFSEDFLKTFPEVFYDLHTIEDHVRNLGSMAAKGLIQEGSFVEGYGSMDAWRAKFQIATDSELLE